MIKSHYGQLYVCVCLSVCLKNLSTDFRETCWVRLASPRDESEFGGYLHLDLRFC